MDDPLVTVMLDHFDIDGETAQRFADDLRGYVENFEVRLYDKRDLKALKRIADALSELHAALGDLSDGARGELSRRTTYGPTGILSDRFDLEADKHAILRFLQDTGNPAAETFDNLVMRSEYMAKSTRATRNHIERSEQLRRSLSMWNLEGIAIVSVCAGLWEWAGGRRVPRGDTLNPTGPFGLFLSDVLEALGLDHDPRTIFSSWKNSGIG